MPSSSEKVYAVPLIGEKIRGHLEIARMDHWFKNVFMLPGIAVALSLDPSRLDGLGLWLRIALAVLSICLVASSNYSINELLDARYDKLHPTKADRPVPAGRVVIPLVYVQWIGLMVAGVAVGLLVSRAYGGAMLGFWMLGCVYNVPPLRSKDLPYIDVLSEALNNPLRMLAGWFAVGTTLFPPVSLLLSYWMIGSYFMGMKRFAEYRMIADPAQAAAYRKSFGFYTEDRLLVSIMFYGSAAMLFFGAFIMRYRLELIGSFPFVALIMALYLASAFKRDSAVQRPEGLYREPLIMIPVVICTVLMIGLLFIDVPLLHDLFSPTAPTNFGR